jgi:hypothetical protein
VTSPTIPPACGVTDPEEGWRRGGSHGASSPLVPQVTGALISRRPSQGKATGRAGGESIGAAAAKPPRAPRS